MHALPCRGCAPLSLLARRGLTQLRGRASLRVTALLQRDPSPVSGAAAKRKSPSLLTDGQQPHTTEAAANVLTFPSRRTDVDALERLLQQQRTGPEEGELFFAYGTHLLLSSDDESGAPMLNVLWRDGAVVEDQRLRVSFRHVGACH